MSNVSVWVLLSGFGRFDIYIGNNSPLWYWNRFTRTSLSCSIFPIEAKLMGEKKLAWALCALSAVYASGCVRAIAEFAFC